MPDEFGGIEADQERDEFGGVAVADASGASPLPAVAPPDLTRRLSFEHPDYAKIMAGQGKGPTGMESGTEFTAAAARGGSAAGRAVGSALTTAGKAIRDVAGAYAFEAVAQPELQAKQLGVTDAQLGKLGFQTEGESETSPIEEGMAALPTVPRVAAKATYGTIEAAPRLAATAGMQALGVPAPIAAGIAFGAQEGGFDVKQGAVVAAVPFIAKYSGAIVEALAKRLGTTSENALALYNAAGGATGAATALAGAQIPDIVSLPADKRQDAVIDAIASSMGALMLAAPHVASQLPRMRFIYDGPGSGRRAPITPEVVGPKELPGGEAGPRVAPPEENIPDAEIVPDPVRGLGRPNSDQITIVPPPGRLTVGQPDRDRLKIVPPNGNRIQPGDSEAIRQAANSPAAAALRNYQPPAPPVEESKLETFFKGLTVPTSKLDTYRAYEAGMAAKTVADLERLAQSREDLRKQMEELKSKATTPAALGDLMRVGIWTQLPREAIEAATNTGSAVEGEGTFPTKLGDRPLDWRKNPEVAKWLRENADRLGITLPEELRNPPPTPQGVPPEPVFTTHVEGHPIGEVPLDQVTLSEEVPQFKKGANEKGVVKPLGGKYDRRGVAPIQLWRRKDGKLEVISGRHRFDLAKRTGEKSIPAQIYNEAEGFDAAQAARLDAELNIRDEQGEISDYANYFKHSEISEKEANARGLLARAKGEAGWAIGRHGSPDLFALHQAERLNDAQAEAIANAAPGSAALQAVGIRQALEGRSAETAVDMMRLAQSRIAQRQAAGQQNDLFGFDDSAIREMEAQAKLAAQERRGLREQISAVKGASRKPEVARRLGVDVQDPAGVQNRVTELESRLEQLRNHPELAGKEPPAPPETRSIQSGIIPGGEGPPDRPGPPKPSDQAKKAGMDAQAQLKAERAEIWGKGKVNDLWQDYVQKNDWDAVRDYATEMADEFVADNQKLLKDLSYSFTEGRDLFHYLHRYYADPKSYASEPTTSLLKAIEGQQPELLEMAERSAMEIGDRVRAYAWDLIKDELGWANEEVNAAFKDWTSEDGYAKLKAGDPILAAFVDIYAFKGAGHDQLLEDAKDNAEYEAQLEYQAKTPTREDFPPRYKRNPFRKLWDKFSNKVDLTSPELLAELGNVEYYPLPLRLSKAMEKYTRALDDAQAFGGRGQPADEAEQEFLDALEEAAKSDLDVVPGQLQYDKGARRKSERSDHDPRKWRKMLRQPRVAEFSLTKADVPPGYPKLAQDIENHNFPNPTIVMPLVARALGEDPELGKQVRKFVDDRGWQGEQGLPLEYHKDPEQMVRSTVEVLFHADHPGKAFLDYLAAHHPKLHDIWERFNLLHSSEVGAATVEDVDKDTDARTYGLLFDKLRKAGIDISGDNLRAIKGLDQSAVWDQFWFNDYPDLRDKVWEKDPALAAYIERHITQEQFQDYDFSDWAHLRDQPEPKPAGEEGGYEPTQSQGRARPLHPKLKDFPWPVVNTTDRGLPIYPGAAWKDLTGLLGQGAAIGKELWQFYDPSESSLIFGTGHELPIAFLDSRGDAPWNLLKPDQLKAIKAGTEQAPWEQQAEEKKDFKLAPPAFKLETPETVDEQKLRLAKEAAEAKVKADRAEVQKRAATPLKGTTGDLGQGALLGIGEAEDLFAAAKPAKVGPAAPPQAPAAPKPKPAQGDLFQEVSGSQATLDGVADDLYGKPYDELTSYQQGDVRVTVEAENRSPVGHPLPEAQPPAALSLPAGESEAAPKGLYQGATESLPATKEPEPPRVQGQLQLAGASSVPAKLTALLQKDADYYKDEVARLENVLKQSMHKRGLRGQIAYNLGQQIVFEDALAALKGGGTPVEILARLQNIVELHNQHEAEYKRANPQGWTPLQTDRETQLIQRRRLDGGADAITALGSTLKKAALPAAPDRGIAASARRKWLSATDKQGTLPGLGSEAGFIDFSGVKDLLDRVLPSVRAAWTDIRQMGSELQNAREFTPLRQALGTWSARMQRSFGEAAAGQKEIFSRVPDPVRRAGITNFIQAGGDPLLLRHRRNLTATWVDPTTGQPHPQRDQLVAGYEAALSLTPEEVDVARDVRNAFDGLALRGQTYEVLDNFRTNYTPQIWELGQRPGSARTLKERFKYSRPRTFDSFFDGEQAGYVPKTKDIGKLLPVYLHEMNSVIAARQLVEDLRDKTATDGRPLAAPLGLGHYSPPAPPLHPIGATMVIPKISREDMRDYRTIPNQPALSAWRWVTRDGRGEPVMLKADVALHPDAYKALNSALGRSAIRDWYSTKTTSLAQLPKWLVRGLDRGNQEAKRTMFGLFAPFHQVQEATHAAGHRVSPFRVPAIDLENPRQMDAAKHGLMLLPDKASEAQFMEGFRPSGLVSAIPGVGKAADYYANYLFHQYIPGLKFKTYRAILARNLQLYEPKLRSRAVTVSDVKALSAEQANAAFGHLNYSDLGRNPTIQHLAQLGLVAPDFFESRLRFAGQAARGATGARVGREQLLALATLAIGQAAAAYIASKLTGGEWDKERPFEFHAGNRRYTLRSVPEDLSAFLHNKRQYIESRLSPLAQSGLEVGTGRDWAGRRVSGEQIAKDIAQKPLPLTLRAGLKAVMGEKVTDSTLTGLEQLAGAAGLKISRYNPEAEEGVKLRDYSEMQATTLRKLPLAERAAALEKQMGRDKLSEEERGRIWQKLRRQGVFTYDR